MELHQEQLRFITYIIDTLLYKEAKELATEIAGRISTSQLSKLQLLTDSEVWKNPETDISRKIEDYMAHQSSKKTKYEDERLSFAKIYTFLKERKFESIIRNVGFKKEYFPDIADPATDTGYFIKNLLFKEFIFHFVQEMKMKGEGAGKDGNRKSYSYKK